MSRGEGLILHGAPARVHSPLCTWRHVWLQGSRAACKALGSSRLQRHRCVHTHEGTCLLTHTRVHMHTHTHTHACAAPCRHPACPKGGPAAASPPWEPTPSLPLPHPTAVVLCQVSAPRVHEGDAHRHDVTWQRDRKPAENCTSFCFSRARWCFPPCCAGKGGRCRSEDAPMRSR